MGEQITLNKEDNVVRHYPPKAQYKNEYKNGCPTPAAFTMIQGNISTAHIKAVSYTHLTLPTIYSV